MRSHSHSSVKGNLASRKPVLKVPGGIHKNPNLGGGHGDREVMNLGSKVELRNT